MISPDPLPHFVLSLSEPAALIDIQHACGRCDISITRIERSNSIGKYQVRILDAAKLHEHHKPIQIAGLNFFETELSEYLAYLSL